MQSTLNPISNSSSHQFQLPWKYAKPPQCISKTLKFTSKKTLTFAANSLRTSINYEPEESLNKGPEPAGPTKLPVVVRGSGRVSRYFWDGNCLQLISVDGGASSFRFESDDQFRKLFKICSLTVRDFFIPKQVSGNYMGYVKWKFLHRLFSSALQVLATQAMFRAIGIGHSHSLPAAAALNWVMKDGLGRLCRCIYTASLASAFDTNLKRVRFLTSVMFSLSIGVELLTPVFPQYFLLLASLANIAKQISLACYLATGSAVHRSFAVADNLGEISAKAQIQTVCFDNLGLMLAASLNMLLKNNQRLQAGLPFVVYPIFSAIDLLGIYQALKHVHLQTLTKDRLEIILDKWIESGHVPSPAEVSKDEGIDFLWSKGRQMWPIRIGCINPKGQIPKLSMMAMQSLSGEDYYFMCMEIFCRGLARKGQLCILLCLREGASSTDIILGMLQACYVRKALQLSSWWMNMVVAGDVSDLVLNEWFKLNEGSKQCAKRDMCLLNEQMSGLGWAMKNILLSTQERVRYSFVDD
ncbi:hypothetical protein AB3S75_002064 [Citrus x aurantiifolia]